MTVRQARVIEIIRRIVCHTDLLHHPPGTHIAGRRERNDLAQSQRLKPEPKGLSGAFGRQAAPPIFERDPPPNLDAGHEMRFERGNRKSDEPDECVCLTQLSREEPKAMQSEMRVEAVHRSVTFGA